MEGLVGRCVRLDDMIDRATLSKVLNKLYHELLIITIFKVSQI